jgi:hypothetical protein
MYLKSLELQNVRLLAPQKFSFMRGDGTPRMWTVFLGDNGMCKSTVLQTIALASAGLKQTTALARDAGTYRRRDDEVAQLDAVFAKPQAAGAAPDDLTVRLAVEPGRYDFTVPAGGPQGAQELDDVRGRRTAGWFVAAYGVGRFLPRPGEVATPQDPVIDRVEGLFDKRHRMLGTDFYAALVQRERRLALALSRELAAVLTAERDGERLFPLIERFRLMGKGGVTTLPRLLEARRFDLQVGGMAYTLPATALSDGYQSMLAWIADLLGHAFLEGDANVQASTLRGIVLLDEIDLHLHPSWQRRLVPLLKQVFPQLQFIVTTHSPLVLAGFEQDEIVRLRLQGDLVGQEPAPLQPGLLTAPQLLNTYFDVAAAGRPELVADEDRYLELKGVDSPTPEEQQELADLERKLRPYVVSPLEGLPR